ncbi:MAG: PorV/PorQ family protein [Elusimicrobia bacterium]|nr:PorV/PorQ family protein [Elusimicrobiota bacterium]
MVRRIPFLLAGIAALFLGLGSKAQARRSDVFEFLRLPSGARTAALGGAGVAEAKGVAGADINPAGLGRLWRDEAAFSGSRWLDDGQYQSLGYAHPFFKGGALAVSVLSVDYGDIPGYSPAGNAEGSVSTQDLAARAGYGRAWKNRVWWGAQGIYAQETLAGDSANAIAASGGLIWSPVVSGKLRTLSIGGAFQNWGKEPEFDGTSEPLPQTVQAGLNLHPFFDALSVSVDGIYGPRKPFVFVAGAEYWARGAVALRVGYNGREAKEGAGVSLGFGFRAWDLEVDYAYVGLGELGETHHMGLTFRFGSLAEKHYARGLENLQREDYAQAVVSFAESVRMDPSHRRALEKLRQANNKLQQENPRTP